MFSVANLYKNLFKVILKNWDDVRIHRTQKDGDWYMYIYPQLRVWMGLTDNWQLAKILTDNWQMVENLTDNWHLPWVLLSADKGPDCPLFSTKPVFKALK